MSTKPIAENILLKDMIRTDKKLKKDELSIAEYRTHGKYSDTAVSNKFGSWNRAIALANLKICSYGRISKYSLMKNLELVWRKLGRRPLRKELLPPLSLYSPGTYQNHFGSFNNALDELYTYIKDKRKYLNQLRTFETEKMEKLTSDALAGKKLRKKRRKNITYRLRYMVLNRDRYKCLACGASPSDDKKVNLQIDHIIPLSKGGETTIKNLQTLCSICNNGKGNYHLEDGNK